MKTDLRVPEGTIVYLRAGTWYSPAGEPAREDVLVRLRAVGQDMRGGLVAANGHECNPHQPDCGRDHCWEAQVLVPALRTNLEGAS